jgi:dihydrofolate synthase/folylpolyglutamate synthase
MNYQETTDWMFNQLPMYQLQGASAYKKDLTNTHLIDHLSNPHKKSKMRSCCCTNGKDLLPMLASVLQEGI